MMKIQFFKETNLGYFKPKKNNDRILKNSIQFSLPSKSTPFSQGPTIKAAILNQPVFFVTPFLTF
jgi:hypothetical protein